MKPLNVERLARALRLLAGKGGYPVWREKPDKGNPSVVSVKPDHKATARAIAAEYAALAAAEEEKP